MSAPAIRAWNNVTRQQLEVALSRLHPDDRPSYEATVAVGEAVAVLINGKKGYCDSTTQQFYDHLKGAFGESVIRNALWALRVAGVIAQVHGGTIGKDGKGRGAHRVFIDADTNGLIPDGYVPPLPRRDPPTGHDLSQTWNESNTGKRESDTGSHDSDTGHDLSTPKESISSSTAALAGRSTTQDSLGQVVEQESEMPPHCETCATMRVDGERIDLLTLAVITRDQRRMSQTARKRLRKCAEPYAVVVVKHFSDRPQKDLADLLVQVMTDAPQGPMNPQNHDYVLDVAAQHLN